MTDSYKILIELMTCRISQAQMDEKQKIKQWLCSRSAHNFKTGNSALILQEIVFPPELNTEQFLELLFSPVYL